MQVECPSCKATFNYSPGVYKPKKVCAACKKPIGKAHKWHFREDGKIEHRHCNNPESYHA